MAHETGDVQGDPFSDLELLEGRGPVRSGEEEEQRAPGVVAEAEALAAGWMLDFFCAALCRAFRDGRLDDFHRTRDCAEGASGLPGPCLAAQVHACVAPVSQGCFAFI